MTLALTGEAQAWNSRGYMMVAAVAWENLSPETCAKVTALLRLNPSYAKWTSGISASNRDAVAFVKAATWADEIRSAPGYYDTLPSGVASGVAYADKLKHLPWHFKNLAFSTDGTDTLAAAEPNAETQIKAFVETLDRDDVSNEEKSYALAWLLHLIGDVHQPLHATARFTKKLPEGDQGGNKIDVCTRSPCNAKTSTSLHSFWDQAVGTSSSPTGAIAAAARLTLPSPSLAGVLSPGTWLDESLALAKSTVYRAPIGPGGEPYLLTEEYRKRAGSIAERRIALAGLRLGNVLNNAFAGSEGIVSRHWLH